MTKKQNAELPNHAEGSEPKVEVVNVNLAELPEVEREREPLTDLNKHAMKLVPIEKMEIIRIPSPYAKSADKKVHKLRVLGVVVETVTTEEGKVIEFRPSELLDLEEDKQGNLKGFPQSEKSKWQRLKRTLNIGENRHEAVGKPLPIRINVQKNGSEWLGYLY